jgi:uncharacterized protein YyaL (SSP411 family)
MPNRLASETSPYLLQHAHNPVDWYPWGPDALEKARAEDKPILLSIGYSACHWCHVMERESFENDDIARLMNDNFVNIKVDREERPDLDAIYMQAVLALTGHGGWPMTVFLTPNGEPFYGGTYFPPQDRGQMPGFPRVLLAMSEAYKTRRTEVTQATTELVSRLQQGASLRAMPALLTKEMLDQALQGLGQAFDQYEGGFADAPKFPQPMTLDFLLRYYHTTRDAKALHMVELTLQKMARGGIYDQLGGGFHRYSVDARWLVPHFEKMLYDNALLSRLYLDAFKVTGRSFYRRVVDETLAYVLREMTGPEGGFYSSQDADSEGEEGKFFVWTPQEIETLLGKEDADLFSAYYDVTDIGNFEHKNILNVPTDASSVAREIGVPLEKLALAIQRGKKLLMETREKRVHPGRDDKVLTAWNGLMLRSFAEAAAALDNPEYRKAAVDSAQFLTTKLMDNGRLLRTYKTGQARLKGYLEDYSFLIDGLIAVYELTLDSQWLDHAHRLTDAMIDLFWDDSSGVFYDTGNDHEALLIRPRELFDNAMPCGSSVAVDVLLRMALLTGNEDYKAKAGRLLNGMGNMPAQYVIGMGRWLAALDFYLAQPKEIVIVGPQSDPAAAALLKTVHSRYLPHKVVAGMEQDDPMGANPSPLLKFRTKVQGKPAAYVCENYACLLPVTTPDDLIKQLEPQPSS